MIRLETRRAIGRLRQVVTGRNYQGMVLNGLVIVCFTGIQIQILLSAAGNSKLQWVITMWVRGISLTDGIIQTKARRLQRTVNQGHPPAERTNCTFSKGCLYSLRSGTVFVTTNRTVKKLTQTTPTRKLAPRYALCDIFNADEFGLS